MLKCDVAVIGGGMAGAMAALGAGRGGKKVILFTKGAGATTLSSGAIDVCGSPISAPGVPLSRFLSVRENLFETIARMPHHPYSVLALNNPDDPAGGMMAMIEETMGFLREKLRVAGMGLLGDASRQKPAPTMLGTWKLTSFVQATQQLGAPEGKTAVAGIIGLSAPDAGSLASSLQATLAATGLGGGDRIEHFEVELGGRKTWTMEEACLELARPGGLKAFLGLLEEAAGNRYRTILIPPVLPPVSTDVIAVDLKAAHSAVADQMKELRLPGGTIIKEMLATPPSTPGRRLKDALDTALESAGVEVFRASASGFERNRKALASCSVEVNGATRHIQADAWVLASGKFIAGGLKKDRAFSEANLNLPLFCDGRQVDEIFTQRLLRRNVLADHPVFGVGLMTDRRLRPIDQDGKVILENLFAAGSVLGGYNYHTGGCGLGLCCLTGYRAGREACVEIL